MAQLEEPGWPNLPDQGAVLVNAFAAGAAINQRRQALEEKLREADMRMQMQDQKHDIDMQKMGFNQMLATSEFNRKLDSMSQQAFFADKRLAQNEELGRAKLDIADRRADVYQKNAELKFNQAKDHLDKFGDYSDEVSAISERYPFGSQAWQDQFGIVQHDYSDIQGTPEVQRLNRSLWQQHKFSSDQLHKNADQRRKDFTNTLNMLTKGKKGAPQMEDFNRPDSEWGDYKDADGNPTKAIAVHPTLGVLHPKDVPSDWQKQGVWFKTLPKNEYDIARQLHGSLIDTATGELSKRPAVTGEMSKVKMRNPNGDLGLIPSQNVQAALDQGYSIEQ